MKKDEHIIIRVIKNPLKIVKHIGGKGYLRWIPDKIYLKMCYRGFFGKKLNLDNPQTFNEKLQWLKLYDRKPNYTTMVDKYKAKEYVASIIGKEYIIPTLGVWNSFDEIDFDVLPNQFVLKCTHDSGGLVICKDKSVFDKDMARKKIEKSLKRQFFYVGREWAYKDVKPRIIAETYMEDVVSGEFRDYKLMCHNGKVKNVFVCSNRRSKEALTVTFHDTDLNILPFDRYYPRSNEKIPKPATYDQIIKMIQDLSEKLNLVDVDFYEIKGKPYFGDLTLHPSNGIEGLNPDEFDYQLGEWHKFSGGYLIDTEYSRLFLHIKGEISVYNKDGLTDYKFYCFNGVPRFLYVSYNLTDHDNSSISFYDMNFCELPFGRSDYKKNEKKALKPYNFALMKNIATKLATDTSFVRVDLYEINKKVYFSELTLYPSGGFMMFEPDHNDLKIGNLLRIESKKNGIGVLIE